LLVLLTNFLIKKKKTIRLQFTEEKLLLASNL
jgi:hypothetical protein